MFRKITVQPVCYGKNNNIHYKVVVLYHKSKKQIIRLSVHIDDGFVVVCQTPSILDRAKVVEALKVHFMDYHVAINENTLKKPRKGTTVKGIKLAQEMGLLHINTEHIIHSNLQGTTV